jgi:predicted DNA-binding transcriptional regulator AlpA
MIKVLETKEVSQRIGKSIRRTQELINGTDLPRVEIRTGNVVRLGVPASDVAAYVKRQKASA